MPTSQGRCLCPPAVPPPWWCPCDAEGSGPGEAAHRNISPVPVLLPPSARRPRGLVRLWPSPHPSATETTPEAAKDGVAPGERRPATASTAAMRCEAPGMAQPPPGAEPPPGMAQPLPGAEPPPGKSQKGLERARSRHGIPLRRQRHHSPAGIRLGFTCAPHPKPLPKPCPAERGGSHSPLPRDAATHPVRGACGPSVGRGGLVAGLWLPVGGSGGNGSNSGLGRTGGARDRCSPKFLRASNKGVVESGETPHRLRPPGHRPPAPGQRQPRWGPARSEAHSRGGGPAAPSAPRPGGPGAPQTRSPSPQKPPRGPRGGCCRQVALKKKGWGRPGALGPVSHGHWSQSWGGTGPAAPRSGWHWDQCLGLTGRGRAGGGQPRQYIIIIIIYPVYWSCA